MADRLDLPRRPFPRLEPEPGDFEAALGRARSRRRRKALETGAALSLAVSLALGVSLRDGPQSVGVDPVDGRRIDQTQQHPQDTPSADPAKAGQKTAAPPVTPAKGGSRPNTSSRKGTGTGSGTGAVPPPPVAVPRVPREPGDPPPVPQPKRPIQGDDADTAIDQEHSADCVQNGGADGWCLDAKVVWHETEQPPYTLSLTVCRGVGSGELNFDTTQRVDFEVRQGSQLYWKWSTGQTFADTYHGKTFSAGDCITWFTGWEDTDEEGYLIPEGTYTLVAWATADELADRKTTYTFNVATD